MGSCSLQNIGGPVSVFRRFRQARDKQIPYIFNQEKALLFLNWMKLFRHRKVQLLQRIDPHPIQKFIFSNIYGWVYGYRLPQIQKPTGRLAGKRQVTKLVLCRII